MELPSSYDCSGRGIPGLQVQAEAVGQQRVVPDEELGAGIRRPVELREEVVDQLPGRAGRVAAETSG